MKLLSLALLALGALALPNGAQALTVSILWDASNSTGSSWSEHVQTGLALSLDNDEEIEVRAPVAYQGSNGFAEAVSGLDADVIVTDLAEASDLFKTTEAKPLFINLSPVTADTCNRDTVHLAGDVAIGRLAAIYMNGLDAQRTFAFVKENDEGKKHLEDFRRAFTGGLGGAAFAQKDQSDFDNEIAILRVTKADGAYFDLEGEALYGYLDAFASGIVSENLSTVTTSKIDYDRLSEETRKALGSMTLVSAWNPDTVDAADFKAAFNTRLGEDPSFAGLMGYEAGDLLTRAMTGSQESLFDNVVALSWQSPRGPVSFDPHGYAIVPVGAYSFTEAALSLKGRISVPTQHACNAS